MTIAFVYEDAPGGRVGLAPAWYPSYDQP